MQGFKNFLHSVPLQHMFSADAPAELSEVKVTHPFFTADLHPELVSHVTSSSAVFGGGCILVHP